MLQIDSDSLKHLEFLKVVFDAFTLGALVAFTLGALVALSLLRVVVLTVLLFFTVLLSTPLLAVKARSKSTDKNLIAATVYLR